MRRVQADDAEAFSELYDRFIGRVFPLALRICGGTERAEEAVQDGFLSLWRSRARFDPERGNVSMWVTAMIRNRCIDSYRHNVRGDGLRAAAENLDYLAAEGSVAQEAADNDQGRHLRDSLQQLPDDQREAIVLAYFGELSQTEIAERLEIPLGTVKGRIRLGLSKVRADLEASGQVG